jgi:hypothetical protein
MLASRSGVASSFALLVAVGCGSGSGTSGPPQSTGGVSSASGGTSGVDGATLGGSGGVVGASGGQGTASSGGASNGGADGGQGACVQGVSLAPEAPWPQCFTKFTRIGPKIVTTACTPGTPPTPQGGTIPAGLYTLQSRTMFASSCPQIPDEQASIVVCGDTWDWGIIYDPSTSPATYLYDFAVTQPTPSSVTLTPRCETDTGNAVDDFGYTYAAGQLTIISSTTESVYVKM